MTIGGGDCHRGSVRLRLTSPLPKLHRPDGAKNRLAMRAVSRTCHGMSAIPPSKLADFQAPSGRWGLGRGELRRSRTEPLCQSHRHKSSPIGAAEKTSVAPTGLIILFITSFTGVALPLHPCLNSAQPSRASQRHRGVARFRTCHGTSLQFAVRIMLASVGTCRGMSAITHSLPASKTLGGSKSRLCAKDHASNLEEVRSLVTNEQSNKCLEEEL